MDDYTELPKTLRHCAKSDGRGCAADCRFGKEHPVNYRCIDYMLEAAADAIEESLVPDTNVGDKCDFCGYTELEGYLPNKPIPHDFRVMGDGLYYADSVYGWEGITVNYCPMCGRKLTEPPKEEA